MSMITCLHPNCFEAVARGRVCCKRHWYSLPDELRSRLSRAKEEAAREQLCAEIVEHFQEHLIGDHEVVTCNGRRPYYIGCGALIVWLPAKSGKMMPVNADTVEADDDGLKKKHVLHFKTCTASQPG